MVLIQKKKKTSGEHIDNCYKYLLQLALRKEYNDRATKHNVDIISKMIDDEITSKKSKKSKKVRHTKRDDTTYDTKDVRKDDQAKSSDKLRSPRSLSDSESSRSASGFQEEQLEQGWSRREAETLIQKIRTYTIETNKFIRSNERMHGITTKNVDECFQTMSSLMKKHDGLIINLISDIVVNFITQEKFKTTEVLKAIHSSYNGKSLLEESKVASPSYTETPDSEKTPNYNTILTPIERKFQEIITNKSYNRGLKILLMVLDHADYSSKPQSSEPQSSDPQSSDPQSSNPQSSKPQSSNPQSSKPQSSKKKSSKPQSSKKKSSEPTISKSDSSKSHDYESDALLNGLGDYEEEVLINKDIEELLTGLDEYIRLQQEEYSEKDIKVILDQLDQEELAMLATLYQQGGSRKSRKPKKSRKQKKSRKVNNSRKSRKPKKSRKQSHYKSLFGKTLKRHTKTI